MVYLGVGVLGNEVVLGERGDRRGFRILGGFYIERWGGGVKTGDRGVIGRLGEGGILELRGKGGFKRIG